MKLIVLAMSFIALSAFAGNKTERKVVAEFPCGIQKEGQIDVSRGLGKILKAFDTDGDGFVTNYCRTTTTVVETGEDENGNEDYYVDSNSSYNFDNCAKTEEIERTKDKVVVRHQMIYTRKLTNSGDLASGCQQAALGVKQLIDMKLAKAVDEQESVEAEILNTLGEKLRVVKDL